MDIHSVNKRLKEISSFFSRVNKHAYKDIYLLSNEVLSKNPFSNTFLDNHLSNKLVKIPCDHKLLGKLIIYYVKSTLYYVLYLFNILFYHLSKLRFDLNRVNDELILIDTFFLVDKIEKERKFHDYYFPGLEKILKKLGKSFAYVPVFYSVRSPLRLYKTLRLLKEEDIPVLSEYQLLSCMDLVFLLWFLLIYPFHVLKLIYELKEDSYENKLLKYELLNTINQVTFFSYARYLEGKKIASLPCANIKFISWYENQTIDKNIFKGLRTGKSKIFIYGAQLFLYPISELNIPVDESEASCDIIPDKILVSGTYYIPKESKLPYAVGPSFRYSQLLDTKINFEKRKRLLVLLPYHDYEIVHILKLLKDVKWKSGEILIKFHPTTNREAYKRLIARNATIVEHDIYDLFQVTKIVIGSESGSLIEAACLGIPSIIVQNPKRFSHNPFPEKGKEIIWDSGRNAQQINALIRKFDVLLANNKNEILRFASDYKDMFFCKVKEKNITEAFDLK